MGMENAITARTMKSQRTRTIIICAVLLVLVIMGAGLSIYNMFMLISTKEIIRLLYVLGYLIGIVLASMYILITMNIVFSTLLTTDKRFLIMKRWDNGFIPYNSKKIRSIIGDFTPSKTEVLKIPIKEIDFICIGTVGFLKRNIEDPSFIEELKKSEQLSVSARKYIRRSEIIYVHTEDGECAYMPINNFDSSDVIKVLKSIKRINADIEYIAGVKKYRKAI